MRCFGSHTSRQTSGDLEDRMLLSAAASSSCLAHLGKLITNSLGTWKTFWHQDKTYCLAVRTRGGAAACSSRGAGGASTSGLLGSDARTVEGIFGASSSLDDAFGSSCADIAGLSPHVCSCVSVASPRTLGNRRTRACCRLLCSAHASMHVPQPQQAKSLARAHRADVVSVAGCAARTFPYISCQSARLLRRK